MFGIGFGEMVIIAVILLLAVGPKQLPALMKTVGKGMRDLRRASDELRKSTGIDELLNDEDLRNPMRPEAPKPRYQISPADVARQEPLDGVDGAYARESAERAARLPRVVHGPGGTEGAA
jgi:sec-independent protein translocase protein TatB